jgi:hypothetical protein
MGFDVWVARSPDACPGVEPGEEIDALHAAQADEEANVETAGGGAAQRGRIQVGPGRGSTLLVCASAADSASKFAADLVRALGGDPAWAWPIRGVGRGVGRNAGGDSLTLEEAIGARLITRVFVFGGDTESWLFAGAIPPLVGSATVTSLAGLAEISRRGAAKRALWRCLQDPLRSESPGGSLGPAA